eukprot:COSAG05_NODE_1479_length_4770_cov_4.525583_5_plen_165_part_00
MHDIVHAIMHLTRLSSATRLLCHACLLTCLQLHAKCENALSMVLSCSTGVRTNLPASCRTQLDKNTFRQLGVLKQELALNETTLQATGEYEQRQKVEQQEQKLTKVEVDTQKGDRELLLEKVPPPPLPQQHCTHTTSYARSAWSLNMSVLGLSMAGTGDAAHGT